MKNIREIIYENGIEATEKLKQVGGSIVFCEEGDFTGDEPYVLMDFGGDGEITDNVVYEVKLVDGAMQIKTRNGWYPLSETINSENNVYESIDTYWQEWKK